MRIALLLATLVYTAHAKADSFCGKLSSANDILNCIRDKAPQVQSAKSNSEGAEANISAAKRWFNPSVNAQSVFGKNLGNEQNETQIALNQTFEVGGARSGRIQAAEAQSQDSKADYLSTEAQQLIEGGTDLIRLLQIRREKATLAEAVNTFSKLIGQFQSRPRLSSEQEVSLAVFKLAKGDFVLRTGIVQEEEWTVLSRFKQSLGLEESELLPILPNDLPNIPNVNELSESLEFAPEVMKASSAVSLATANLKVQRWDPISEITFGPMAQFNIDGPTKSQMFGLQLTLPFPVWNQNGYGKEAAQKLVFASETRLNFEVQKTNEDRKRFIKVLKNLQSLLSQAPSQKEMELKHEKIERLFFQGLVNSALVIEAHRSLIDVQKSRHETEVNLLKNLWGIYRIDGKTSEIKL